MALGHGGQILVSDTTAVHAAQPADAASPRRARRCAASGGGSPCSRSSPTACRASSPSSAASTTSRATCRGSSSSLVGREQLVTDVAELVRSDRLVTLCGVGGVGKTRLSLEVGAELASEFPDGVWIVELAAVERRARHAGGDRDGDGHHAAGRRAAARHCRRGRGRPANAADPRQLRARPERRDARRRGDAGSRREPQDRGNVTRAARPHRGDGRDREPAPRGRRDHVRRRHPVRRSGPRRATQLRDPGPDRRRGGDRDLRDRRRTAARDRAGGGTHGGDERGRGQGSARGPLPPVAGNDARTRSASSPCVTPSSGPTTC